jgi:hypothetical protein
MGQVHPLEVLQQRVYGTVDEETMYIHLLDHVEDS